MIVLLCFTPYALRFIAMGIRIGSVCACREIRVP